MRGRGRADPGVSDPFGSPHLKSIPMSTATSVLRGARLARRMTSVLAATLLIALAGSGFGAWSLGQVAKRTDEIVGQSLATERLIVDWHRNVAIGIRRTTAMAVSADPSLADYF